MVLRYTPLFGDLRCCGHRWIFVLPLCVLLSFSLILRKFEKKVKRFFKIFFEIALLPTRNKVGKI